MSRVRARRRPHVVRVTESAADILSAMLALICPSCGGPLPSHAAALPLVTCAYCSVSVSRHGHGFKVQEGSVARPPSDAIKKRLSDFHERIAAGIKADGDPVEILKRVLHEQLGFESEADVVARITLGLAADVKAQCGVDVSRDSLVLCRLGEAYLQRLDELREAHTAELNLPFIAVTSQGPVHYTRTITIADLEALATVREPEDEPSPAPRKKNWWWPF